MREVSVIYEGNIVRRGRYRGGVLPIRVKSLQIELKYTI